jgi:hypothetical protein
VKWAAFVHLFTCLKTQAGVGGFGSKSQTRAQGLGSGSAVSNDNGGWWWVVVGLLERRRIHKRERGKEVGGQKPETEPAWLSFGSAVLNGGGERWWMSVGLLVKSDGGRRAAHSQTRAGERDWEPKT